MVIVWLALLGATLVVGILVALVYATARGRNPELRAMAIWAGKLWVLNLGLELAILYFAEPALTGPYLGGQWLLAPLFLSGVLAFFDASFIQVRRALDSFTERVNRGSVVNGGPMPLSKAAGDNAQPLGSSDPMALSGQRSGQSSSPPTGWMAGAIAAALVIVFAVIGNAAITVATTWFNANAQALAKIPHIVTEAQGAPLPSTDMSHIVVVSHGAAAYLGQQALSAGPSLVSKYHTNLQEYSLEIVDGHLYWIAPLISNNVWASLAQWESPGFVAVDAENPADPPKLHLGLHLRYLPDALFNQDLVRHVYLSGYIGDNLSEPIFEVDDRWRPYYTLSQMAPTRGFTGDIVTSVLVVDPQSGEIQRFSPGQAPYWVDRIIPATAVIEYLDWWGAYSSASWFNPSGDRAQMPSDTNPNHLQLSFAKSGSPDWLVPMVSSSGKHAETGIVLFNARSGNGYFYPISGLGTSATAQAIFSGSPGNTHAYQVSNVQLYDIYGQPTWVATFYQPDPFGEIIHEVGLVDARRLNPANVIMAPDKSRALADYAAWLKSNNLLSATTVIPGTS